jgi:hypothetical protein
VVGRDRPQEPRPVEHARSLPAASGSSWATATSLAEGVEASYDAEARDTGPTAVNVQAMS